MSVELLNVDCMEYMATQPDNVFDLIIADPPYYEVKGEFDYKWPDFDSYLADVEIWAKQIKRIAKDSASLFWWGNSKKIAYSQIILDKYFNLENSLVWEKKDSIQYQYYSPELARCYNTHNERVLYYSCEKGMTGREFIESEYIAPRNPFAIYLKEEFQRSKVSNKEIAGLFPSKTGGLTGCVSNWLNGNNVITENQYLRIRKYLNCEYLRKEYDDLRKEYDDLRKEYDDLRKEYDDLRRPFNNYLKVTEILTYSQQANETKYHGHPTQKAPVMTKALLSPVVKRGNRVFIPFLGSGVEAIECFNQGMDVVGCEIDEDYYKAAKERFEKETAQLAMFA